MSPKIITDGWFASQRSMIVIAVSHFHVYISSSLVEAFSKHKLREGLLTALCSHLEHRDVVLGQVELQQRGEEELGQQPGLGEAEARVDTEPAQEGSPRHLSRAANEGPQSFHKVPTRVCSD